MITDTYVLWIGRFATLEVVLNDDSIHGTGPAQPYLAGISRLGSQLLSLFSAFTLFSPLGNGQVGSSSYLVEL